MELPFLKKNKIPEKQEEETFQPPAKILGQGMVDIKETGWFGSKYYDNEPFRNKVPHNGDKLFPAYFEEDQLYNLEDDPLEQVNLAQDPAYRRQLDEMRIELKAELQKLPHIFGEFNN